METANSIKKSEPDKSKLEAFGLKSRKVNCQTIQNPVCRLIRISQMQSGVSKFLFVQYVERLKQTREPLEHLGDKSLIPGKHGDYQKKPG